MSYGLRQRLFESQIHVVVGGLVHSLDDLGLLGLLNSGAVPSC
jgi:hypothetical protein